MALTSFVFVFMFEIQCGLRLLKRTSVSVLILSSLIEDCTHAWSNVDPRYQPCKVDMSEPESQSSIAGSIESHKGVKQQPTGLSKKQKCGKTV